MRPLILISTVALVFLSCVYPTMNGDPYTIEEQQSVWQYLNAFSIYQERLPAALGRHTPDDLFNMISDTLKGGRYTGYAGYGRGTIPGRVIDEPVVIEGSPSTLYFQVKNFSDSTLITFTAFRSYMEGFRNLVIDLRGNGGGYVSVAEAMTCEFLPYGTPYIRYHQREYNHEKRSAKTITDTARAYNPNPRLAGKRIAILVDTGSASASEILAAALLDNTDAVMIGSRTYGKGIGQVVVTRGGSGREVLIITSMEISGLSERTQNYNRVGIQPDEVSPDILEEAAAYASAVHQSGTRAHRELAELYSAVKTLDADFTPPNPPVRLTKQTGAEPAGTMSIAAIQARFAETREQTPVGAYIAVVDDPLNDE